MPLSARARMPTAIIALYREVGVAAGCVACASERAGPAAAECRIKGANRLPSIGEDQVFRFERGSPGGTHRIRRFPQKLTMRAVAKVEFIVAVHGRDVVR